MFYYKLKTENKKMAKLNAQWTGGIILIQNEGFPGGLILKNPLPPVAWSTGLSACKMEDTCSRFWTLGSLWLDGVSSLPRPRQTIIFFPRANSHTLPTLTGSASLAPQAVLSSLPTFWEAIDHAMVIAHIACSSAIAQSDKQISHWNMSSEMVLFSRIFSASSQMNIQRKTIIL